MTQPAEKEFRIGIWGPSGVSKTSYLAALYIEFLKHGWGVEVLNDAPYDGHIFIEQVSSQLAQGKFPQRTLPDPTKLRRYGLRFTRPSTTIVDRFRGKAINILPNVQARSFTIDVTDVPGAYITNVPVGLNDGPVMSYFKHLAGCTGIMLMIDPDVKTWIAGRAEDEYSYFEALEKLVMQIRLTHSTPKLAVCMTKADRDSVQGFLSKPSNTIEAFTRNHIGEEAYRRIQSSTNQYFVKYFMVSVVGLYTVPGTNEQRPNLHYQYSPSAKGEVIAYPEVRKPIGIVGADAPLTWILQYQ